MKAEGGFIISEYNALGVSVKEQDGLKLYLLCRPCEEWLGEAESYVAKLLQGIEGVTAGSELHTGDGLEYGDELDRSLLIRFVLSLAWRCSVLGDERQPPVVLAESEEAAIKRQILTPGRSELDEHFVCIAKLLSPGFEVDPAGLVMHYFDRLAEDSFLFELLAGGYAWRVLWNARNHRPPAELAHMNLAGDQPHCSIVCLEMQHVVTFMTYLRNGLSPDIE